MRIKLRNRKNKKSLTAIIEAIIENDYPRITESGNYVFDWRLERYNDVYKVLLTTNEDDIIGLMSLCDYPEENRIHLNLLELSKNNRGKLKRIENIAGCLIAFAARISFERGYLGIVTLEPKSKLIDHYQEKYGFEDVGYMMLLSGEASRNLINKYLTDER